MQSKKTLWDSLYLGIYDILSNRIVKTNENEDPDVVAKWASREFADVLADSVESFINTGGINLDSVEELINYFSNGSANSAVKLKDTHTFWGQPFNGTQDVLGDLKNVGKISASGNISTLGGVSAGGSSDLFELFSSGYTSITEVGTGNGVAFIESDVASIKVHKANFLTEHQSLSAYYTSSEIDILLSTKVAIEDLSQSILDVTDPLYLKLSGGNLTGPLSGTTASFTGNIHSDLNISANGGVSAGGITDLIETTPIIDLYRSWSDSTPTNKALEATLGVELHNSIVSLESISHTHPNKSIIDNTTASFLEEDKSKLQGIAYNANNYSLPIATDLVLGGVKIGSNIDILSGVISVKDASTTVKGLVQLSDSVNSASSSSAATSKAVKIAWDLANSKWAWNEDTVKNVVVNRSLTADKLTTPISLWGQLFDGSSDVNEDLHSTGNISADGGVYAGGIGDLPEAITSGYNDILPYPNDTGNAVTSLTSNGGSTLYYRREKSFSEVGHNHDTAYSLLGHVHDDRYYTEVEISDIFSGLTSVTGYNKSNWDTAYSWGNHASEGYALASALSTHIADVSNPHSVTKLQVGLGNVEDTKLSTWAGTTNITTLGTISDGTWQGNIIGVLYGGTGKNSIAINKMLYASSANVFSEIPTTSFGRGLLNTASGTVIVGLNADLLDGLHGIDFVNVASTQEITGSKTFTKTLNILESLNVSSNIHAGGNISADGGISAGGISDLLETGSSGFNDIEYIGTGNVVTNVEKNVSSLKVFRGFSVYTDIEIDTKFSTEITNRNTAISDAINLLDVASVGGAGKYISAISEANGKISATASDMPTLLSQFTDNLGSSPVHTHSQYMLASARGAVSGVAPLDINRKIPAAYLYDYFFGQVLYGGGLGANALATLTSLAKSKLGTANATITLTNNNTAITGYVANEGIYYIVTAAQTFAGIAFEVGDWCISNGAAWTKVDNTDAVASVVGLTGPIQKASLLSALNVADGAQVNVLESVKLNGTALEIPSKAVNINACTSISVPSGLSVAALTTGGLIAISLATGYVIPTTANITQIGTNTTNIANEITNRIAAISQEVTDRNTAISNAVNALDVVSVGGDNYYLSAISQTDGKISAAVKLTNTLFTGLTNDLEQLSVTIGGKNLKLTVDYATKANQLKNAQTIWGQSFNGTADIKDVMIKYCTGIGYSTTRQIEFSSGLVKINDTLNAASAVFSGNVTDAAIHYFGNGTTYYVNASGGAKFNGTNAGALTATSGEFTDDIHTTQTVRGDLGVYAGGIADLAYTSAVIDLYTYWGDNDTTSKALSAELGIELHNSKVDKVTGYGLSKNDLSDALLSALNANTAARHSHSNKSLLDSYTQTESDLASAVLQKHSHSNKAVLDATTASFLSADKTKLNGIADNANNYTHPSYTSRASGLYKIVVDAQGHVSAVTTVVKADITGLGIPAQDTVYTHPSYTVYASGLYKIEVNSLGHVTAAVAVAKADITALGIPAQDTVYTHPVGDGNLHVPATGTTNNTKVLKAGSTAGSIAWSVVDWSELANKPSTFTPSAHNQAISTITGLQTALDAKALLTDFNTHTASAVHITATERTNWNNAFSWGDHQDAGYAADSDLTAHTGNSTIHITATERTNWNAAYGWGNHNSAGYAAIAQTHYVGTTAIAANRASASQALTGITSIDGSAAKLTTGRTLKVNLASTSASTSFNGTADVSDIGVSGILPVANGGTGLNALTSGYALIGNGTGAVTLRAITNMLALGPIVYNTNLMTTNTLAFWNGAYDSSGTSNIAKLGTITAGVWHGTTLEVAYGGIGKTNVAANSMLYASSANTYSEVATSSFGRGLLNSASGTVISGLNADTVDGLHVHSGINYEANKVVRTDGNGYLYTGWINTISGGFNGAISGISRIYCSEDAYIRYLTPADFKTAMQLVTLNEAQTITGAKTFSASASFLNSISVANNINAGGIIQGVGGVFAGGIADLGGSEYSVPAASATSIGGIKIGYTNNAKNYKVALDASGNAFVNVPWVDTTYSGGDWITISGTTIRNTGTWFLAESSQNGHVRVYGGVNPSGYDVPVHGLGSAAYTNSYDYAAASHTHTKSQITDFPTTWAWGSLTGIPSTFTPSSHTHGNITNDGKIGSTSALPIITGTGGLLQVGSFGNSAGTFCQGNDSRLSDARTPSAHTLDSHSNVTISSNTAGEILKWSGTAWVNNTLSEAGIAPSSHVGATGTAHGVASTSVNGFMSSTDKSKLDGIADNANNYVLPTADTTTLGGVKVSTGLYAYNGYLSVVYGTTANTACQGNDSRLSDSRPASDVSAWAKASSKPSYNFSEIGNTSDVAVQSSWTTPTLSNGTQGTTYGTVRYRKIGNNVQIDGSFVITWDGSSQLRLFNLPSGYKPTHNMTGWLYNNSNGIWRYVIGTDGWVTLINVKSVTGGSNITTATTCIFNCMIFPQN